MYLPIICNNQKCMETNMSRQSPTTTCNSHFSCNKKSKLSDNKTNLLKLDNRVQMADRKIPQNSKPIVDASLIK